MQQLRNRLQTAFTNISKILLESFATPVRCLTKESLEVNNPSSCGNSQNSLWFCRRQADQDTTNIRNHSVDATLCLCTLCTAEVASLALPCNDFAAGSSISFGGCSAGSVLFHMAELVPFLMWQ